MNETLTTLESMIGTARRKGYVVHELCGPISILATLFGYPFRTAEETYIVAEAPDLLAVLQFKQ